MPVTSRWRGGFESETEIDGGHVVVGDEPPGAGGADTGPSPFGLLLSSLATCTLVTVVGEAQLLGVELDELEVDVKHKQNVLVKGPADPVQRTLRITAFRRHIRLRGDLTDEQVERLRWAAEHCPVSSTLSGGAEVTTTLERLT